jgi:hypothetical protein
MTASVRDYLLDLPDVDWSVVLTEWSWMLPRELTVWLVNRFGDLFIVLPDGSVHVLDIGCGTFERVAESRDDFCARIDEPGNAENWLMMPLVDSLVSAGVALKPHECYAYKQLPILGGEYAVTNFAPLNAAEWIRGCGYLQKELRDLPDGTQVEFRVVD